MLYPQIFFRFIQPVHVHLTDQFFFNVLALENILVALTREIGYGPCFLYIEFFWIGVRSDVGPTFINFEFFSRPYGLIREYIKVI